MIYTVRQGFFFFFFPQLRAGFLADAEPPPAREMQGEDAGRCRTRFPTFLMCLLC